jgi:mRNA interferase RelE/StbE
MSGYTRQQSYIDGDVILAEHTNDEFDLIEEVFSTSLGHKHDGTTAEGPTIDRILDDDGDTGIEVERAVDVDTIVFKTANLDRLDRPTERRIRSRVRQLAADPFNALLSSPLTARPGVRKSRVGEWRILFTVDRAAKVVYIATIDTRGQF